MTFGGKSHQANPEALNAWRHFGDFCGGHERDNWFVISLDSTAESKEVLAWSLTRPCDCQSFFFYDSIVVFCISKRA